MHSLDSPTYVCCGSPLHIGHTTDCRTFAQEMIRVAIESPYAGDVAAHETYARRAMKDSITRGEAPIASHLLYTQEGILDDSDPVQRRLGINCGFAWSGQAHLFAFYIDYGFSRGMDDAMLEAVRLKKRIVQREIGKNP